MTNVQIAPTSISDIETAGWEPQKDDGFLGLVGPIWQRRDGDQWRFGFLAEPKHHNRRQVVQGGMLMTFADRAMGATARLLTGNKPQATVQLDVHFVSSGQIGEFIEAHCEIVKRTRSLIFIQGTLKAGSRTVATAHGIWKLLGDQPPEQSDGSPADEANKG